MRRQNRRYGVRAEVDLAARWYAFDATSRAANRHRGTVTDLSATGARLATAADARAGDAIVLQIEHDHPPVNLTLAAVVVRVTRAAGGYLLGVNFTALEPADRAALGRLVVASIGRPAA